MELVDENFGLFNRLGLIGIFLHFYQNRRLKRTEQNRSKNIRWTNMEGVSPHLSYTDKP